MDLFTIGFITITWVDIIDVLLVSFLFYRLYVAMRGTIAAQVFLGLMLVIGMSNVAATTVVQTVLQAESSAEMRGRVMGAYQQHHVLVAAGGLAAGALASVWGAQMTVGWFGAACALGAIAFFIAVPHVRTIR